MLTLLTFPGGLGLPSLSPFCLKAMALLHLSGMEWRPEWKGRPSATPYGKLPVLRTGDGQIIPDSANIQAWLEAQGVDFHPGLSAAQRAQAHALVVMVEESLRCGLVTDRWLNDANWPRCRDVFFAPVPGPMRGVIANMVRKSVRRAMEAQGMAKFSETDRLARLGRDLDAITVTLGDKAFLFGDAPSAADAAVAPVLAMIDSLPADTGLRRLVRGNAALMEYLPRARAALYPGGGAASSQPDQG